MADAREGRLTALRAALAKSQLDGLLVTSLPNVRYLSGFSGSNAVLFVGQSDALLLTDFRYKTQVAEEVGDLIPARIQTRLFCWMGMAISTAGPALNLTRVKYSR